MSSDLLQTMKTNFKHLRSFQHSSNAVPSVTKKGKKKKKEKKKFHKEGNVNKWHLLIGGMLQKDGSTSIFFV